MDQAGGKTGVVEAPEHYRAGDAYETIRVIEAWGLGYHLGNVIKYVSRWERKGGLEDLKKARWYLTREIERQEKSSRHEDKIRGRTTPVW